MIKADKITKKDHAKIAHKQFNKPLILLKNKLSFNYNQSLFYRSFLYQ